MKILLFGEYSGLFNCLCDGLVANGHEVVMASDGNGYKNYPRDIDWFVNPKFGKAKHFIEFAKIYQNRKYLKGFDAVHLISPTIFSKHRIFIKPIFDYLINNNEKVFLSGAGMTAVVAQYWYNTNEKYHDYVVGNIKDFPGGKSFLSKELASWEYELLDKINGYIPIWYEYAQPFRNHPKFTKTLRIPINVSKLDYKPNIVNDKIVFFHGIPSRPTAKGTAIIQSAFKKMKEKYADKAEFISAGGLPFHKYMELISRTNVILDDVNSYSIAMNGLFSLAKGKIVMGGAEKVANIELGIEGVNPVYNLCPKVDQICSCIEEVINHQSEIEDMGLRGRMFVEKYHDYRDIAKEYVKIFENY